MKMKTLVLTIAMVTGTITIAHADRAPAKPAAKSQPKKHKAPAASGLKAAKDHGKATLREPTDAEDAALGANPNTGVVTSVRPGAVAGTTAILGDEMLSDMVVEKQADGTLKTSCGVRGKHAHPHRKAQPKLPTRALETK
ncbi:MAG TPA: hypothetical protein VIU61_17730 [Kofleriaceae bacterium]